MQEFTTPMMKQYLKIKKQYADCLLFFRMGDFYELFLDDAHLGARVLNITLTSRAKGKDGRIPMAGVPYHAVDVYIAKLVKAGYKVAICEQVSEPNKYGIVDREVIRVVTPGTVLDEKALDKKRNNYIMSLLIEDDTLSISVADISTGYFSTYQVYSDNLFQTIDNEVAALQPTECILPAALYNNPELLKLLHQRSVTIYCFHDWDTHSRHAKKLLKKQFGVATLAGFGLEDKPLAAACAAALLGYLQETQKATVSHIKKIITSAHHEQMHIDRSTMMNLELFSTLRDHDSHGSLISVLDETVTAMGGRLLKYWIAHPLIQQNHIIRRHDAVAEFLDTASLRTQVRTQFEQVSDMERLLSRVSVGLGNARDLVNLAHTLTRVLEIKKTISVCTSELIQEQVQAIDPKLHEIITVIQDHIVDEPPIDLKEGGLIKPGIDTALDTLRATVGKSKDWILKLETDERARTGIASLKVRFNNVFGFYIEISNANRHLAPSDYIRKQTLINGERYITPELKHHEEIILSAEEKTKALEYKLFLTVREKLLSYVAPIQHAARVIAVIDCLLNFAQVSARYAYKRPVILDTGALEIHDGRHPVVETLLTDRQFVPNTVVCDTSTNRVQLITGPNMAGKSVYIRQVAIIVLMAQIGCFVPASEARMSVVDRIFVRSGASDVIVSGLSTFMVEMVETAYILHHATENSLIVMDEIGRGTSTYDGISIAWAVAEYLVTNFLISPITLFATHYHELQALEKEHPEKIGNYHLMVQEHGGDPKFLYTVQHGAASHSFGVAVAKLAGIPQPVIDRAHELLFEMEQRGEKIDSPPALPIVSSFVEHIIHRELDEIDIHNMTPLEALNTLAELKEKVRLLNTHERISVKVD